MLKSWRVVHTCAISPGGLTDIASWVLVNDRARAPLPDHPVVPLVYRWNLFFCSSFFLAILVVIVLLSKEQGIASSLLLS
ncbi:hypothetical protein VNO78_10060 [Psophocarpus tetragonolobus]|uniref:Uncharacterized protein n=1 Tax=Psophocarpus tetragonolobus TaxID=3891 RepID=A0AAN9SLL5_PSOTE